MPEKENKATQAEEVTQENPEETQEEAVKTDSSEQETSLQKQIDELNDKLLRTLAEYDNADRVRR